MKKPIYSLAGICLFLIALEILIVLFFISKGLFDPELWIIYLPLALLALAIPTLSGTFFLRVKDYKSKLLSVSAYLISIPTIINLILIILFFLLIPPDPHKGYLGNLLISYLTSFVALAFVSVGLILLIVYLIKNRSKL